LSGLTEVRSPQTGQLIDRGRTNLAKRLKVMRDSIVSIKRYLYRRIVDGAFSPLLKEEVDKSTLRRLVVWLQPTRCTPPTKTEVYCFAANRSFNKNNQGIGTPAVLFPSDNSRTRKDFYQPTYGRLKEWVYTKRCIPGALLELLSGKSFNKRRDSVGSHKTVLKQSVDPLNLQHRPSGRVERMAEWQSKDRKLASSSTMGILPVQIDLAANRYEVLSEEVPSP
jgi:hypothetical protein